MTIIDPAATWIDVDVTLGQDAEIWPGTHLEGRTQMGRGRASARAACCATPRSGRTPPCCTRCASGLRSARAPASAVARLRPGARIGPGAHIGTFVELKNATVGEGTKVPHLTYVGDADIGEHSNIGAATVFVNYDGEAKHHTTVGNHVRIGSDTMLVAPVQVGDGAFTAAGSVITDDVPPGALGVARSGPYNSAGWVERRHPDSPSAAAAARARQAQRPAQNEDEGSHDT